MFIKITINLCALQRQSFLILISFEKDFKFWDQKQIQFLRHSNKSRGLQKLSWYISAFFLNSGLFLNLNRKDGLAAHKWTVLIRASVKYSLAVPESNCSYIVYWYWVSCLWQFLCSYQLLTLNLAVRGCYIKKVRTKPCKNAKIR